MVDVKLHGARAYMSGLTYLIISQAFDEVREHIILSIGDG